MARSVWAHMHIVLLHMQLSRNDRKGTQKNS
jgi:hypothetical protein